VGAAPLYDLIPPSVDWEAAMVIAVARRMRPPMKVFARALRIEIGWSTLSERAVYAWERGEARVPAVALLGAARVTATTVDDLVVRARRLHRLGLGAGD
jgi:hypothetical protein